MKYKVSYTIVGEYEVDGKDFDFDEGEESLEEVKRAIQDDPFVDCNPVTDGKVTIEVEEVKE